MDSPASTSSGNQKLDRCQRRTSQCERRSHLEPDAGHRHCASRSLARKGSAVSRALGSSAASEVTDLAKFLREECGVEAEVLPAMEPPEAAHHLQRKQWIADMLLEAMAAKFPDIAGDADARIIGVIDDDIYPRSLNWDLPSITASPISTPFYKLCVSILSFRGINRMPLSERSA